MFLMSTIFVLFLNITNAYYICITFKCTNEYYIYIFADTNQQLRVSFSDTHITTQLRFSMIPPPIAATEDQPMWHMCPLVLPHTKTSTHPIECTL